MQHFIAMLLVTLCPTLHGSEHVQEKFYRTVIGWSLKLLRGMNQAVTSASRGMALGTTIPSPV